MFNCAYGTEYRYRRVSRHWKWRAIITSPFGNCIGEV